MGPITSLFTSDEKKYVPVCEGKEGIKRREWRRESECEI
jgi:hypothetical protein